MTTQRTMRAVTAEATSSGYDERRVPDSTSSAVEPEPEATSKTGDVANRTS